MWETWSLSAVGSVLGWRGAWEAWSPFPGITHSHTTARIYSGISPCSCRYQISISDWKWSPAGYDLELQENRCTYPVADMVKCAFGYCTVLLKKEDKQQKPHIRFKQRHSGHRIIFESTFDTLGICKKILFITVFILWCCTFSGNSIKIDWSIDIELLI